MKIETFEKAKKLVIEIKNRKETLTDFQTVLKDGGYDSIMLMSTKRTNYGPRSLDSSLCPIKAEDVALLYETRLVAEIASLEKELETLKD